MHVVDVHDVRVDLPDAPDQFARGAPRGESVRVEQARGDGVECQVQPVADRHQPRAVLRLAVAGAAVGDIALPAGGDGQFADLLHDASGGGVLPDDGVDLQQLATHNLPPTSTPVTRGAYFFKTIYRAVTVPSVSRAVASQVAVRPKKPCGAKSMPRIFLNEITGM